MEDLLEPTCLKLLISKALGYLIILGSVAVKVPQILNILKAKSAEGISFSMFFLELVGYTITLSYNIVQGNPFSTWGENLFLLLQTFIIVFLMFRFTTGINFTFISMTVAFVAVLVAMISGSVPMEIMTLLQTSSVGIFIASKVPQVITNFKNRSTGKLAFFTFFLNFAGSSARVFTTLQEVSDKIILTSAILGAVLNAIIAAQIIIFGDKGVAQASTKPQTQKKKKD